MSFHAATLTFPKLGSMDSFALTYILKDIEVTVMLYMIVVLLCRCICINVSVDCVYI